jgi:hypothetical protein
METPVLEVIGVMVQDIRQTSGKCLFSAGWTAYDTIKPSEGVSLVTIVSVWRVVTNYIGNQPEASNAMAWHAAAYLILSSSIGGDVG